MRILITGDRNWTDKEFINKVLRELWYEDEYDDLVIIHGCAKGADSIAGEIGKQNSQNVVEFPADWDKYGKAAGPTRNQQMLDEGKPELVLAFHDNIELSKGTKHMVKISQKAGIETRVYSHSTVCRVTPGRKNEV